VHRFQSTGPSDERRTLFVATGEHMPATILIIEPRPEVATALGDVIASAHYLPIVRPYVDNLADLGLSPAAIVLRVSFDSLSDPPHAALERLHVRPPVIAIVCEEEEFVEAQRLKCDVILRAPGDVSRLCDALAAIVHA
jgi:hypothetical protein